nr:hypothetical protein [Tanacetum cinerariifolium]
MTYVPLKSIRSMRRTRSAYRTPTSTATAQKKKRKQVARETSSPKKSFKVTVKQKKPSTIPIPLPSDDKERDEITEATQLSLVLHKTAKIANEQENVVLFQEKLMEEDIKKIVDGDNEESYVSEFSDSFFQDDDDDFGDDIKPGSHKEHPKTVDDDDENDKEKKNVKKDEDDGLNDDHTNHTLDKSQETGKMKEMSDTLNDIVLELTIEKTNELLKEAILRMVNDTIKNLKSLLHQPVQAKFMMHIKANNEPPEEEKWAKSQKTSKDRVLIKVKLMIFEIEFLKKAPPLGKLDLDIMKAYEREITKRLKHHEQMRRWESFGNGRPILPMMRRQ